MLGRCREYGGDPRSIVLDGRNAHLTDGVQQAVGRPPTDFAEYARRTAASGVWNEPRPGVALTAGASYRPNS
ncbi:hypothetical protein E1287_08130 [Actinomadura sp. KC06]|nr:hypothetical protein E1287_08130 [Actinomadura sp. KC06]